DAAMPLLDSIPAARRLDLVGGPGLAEVAACLGRAALYLGNDSGLMHLAAAMGIPTLGLFGPSPEALYAPWGPRAAVLRTPESYEALVGAPGFDYRGQTSLMTGLTVDAVVKAATALWENQS
ncbi:MAG: glycosyltransferase family 9 protein, partial [Alphaproteobacteria bacterium]|nr:glycosyltransferase family 9 protein [Alphaproteobacteria bacterium]